MKNNYYEKYKYWKNMYLDLKKKTNKQIGGVPMITAEFRQSDADPKLSQESPSTRGRRSSKKTSSLRVEYLLQSSEF